MFTVACGSNDKPATSTFTATGWVKVNEVVVDNCANPSAQSPDIHAGTSLEIQDSTGKVVAVGNLSEGQKVNSVTDGCRYGFSIANVPDGEDFYKVKIGSRPAESVTAAHFKKRCRILDRPAAQLNSIPSVVNPLPHAQSASAHGGIDRALLVPTWATTIAPLSERLEASSS